MNRTSKHLRHLRYPQNHVVHHRNGVGRHGVGFCGSGGAAGAGGAGGSVLNVQHVLHPLNRTSKHLRHPRHPQNHIVHHRNGVGRHDVGFSGSEGAGGAAGSGGSVLNVQHVLHPLNRTSSTFGTPGTLRTTSHPPPHRTPTLISEPPGTRLMALLFERASSRARRPTKACSRPRPSARVPCRAAIASTRAR